MMHTQSHIPRRPPFDAAVQHLLHAPHLPLVVQEFQSVLEAEREKRERFYEAMTEEQKVEFINGEVIVHSPVQLRHTTASRNLLTYLNIFVARLGTGYVGHGKMLIALSRNDYEPDIVYFGQEKARAFTRDQTKFPAPDFIVEILSPSTEAIDRGLKFRDYAAHGVAEYWIIDPEAELVEQYVLEGDAYRLHIKANTGTLYSTVVEGFAVPVRAIFDEAERIAAVQAMLVNDSR